MCSLRFAGAENFQNPMGDISMAKKKAKAKTSSVTTATFVATASGIKKTPSVKVKEFVCSPTKKKVVCNSAPNLFSPYSAKGTLSAIEKASSKAVRVIPSNVVASMPVVAHCSTCSLDFRTTKEAAASDEDFTNLNCIVCGGDLEDSIDEDYSEEDKDVLGDEDSMEEVSMDDSEAEEIVEVEAEEIVEVEDEDTVEEVSMEDEGDDSSDEDKDDDSSDEDEGDDSSDEGDEGDDSSDEGDDSSDEGDDELMEQQELTDEMVEAARAKRTAKINRVRLKRDENLAEFDEDTEDDESMDEEEIVSMDESEDEVMEIEEVVEDEIVSMDDESMDEEEIILDMDDEETMEDESSDDDSAPSEGFEITPEDEQEISIDMLEDDETLSDEDEIELVESSSKDKSFFLFKSGTPVAKLRKARASATVAKLFDEASVLSNAFSTAIEANGGKVSKDIKGTFGITSFKTRFSMKNQVAKEVSKRVASATASLKDSEKKMEDSFFQAMSIASVGVNKRFWKNISNPLKDALIQDLSRLGVRDAAKTVDATFASNGEDMIRVIVEKASSLRDMSVVARNEIAQAVSEASYQNSSHQEEEEARRINEAVNPVSVTRKVEEEVSSNAANVINLDRLMSFTRR